MTVRFPPPGRFRDVETFRLRWQTAAPHLDCDLKLEGREGPLGSPINVFGRRLLNRWAIHPMEGWDGGRDGTPSEQTRRRWRRFGRSGAALVWGGEAFAVQEDGRANPHQLYLNPAIDSLPGLASLKDEIQAGRAEVGVGDEPVAIGLQLTHSGRFACPTPGNPAPRVAYRHPVLDPRHGVDSDAQVLTDLELDGIGDRFVQAAAVAQRAGYDFVDVKCCHGYLLHELLGAHTRDGPYGGSFENRTRMLRRVVEGIRRGCPGLEIGCRVSIVDVFPFTKDADGVGTPDGWNEQLPYRFGFGIDQEDPRQPSFVEPLRLLDVLRELRISAVNLSVGSPYYNPHLQRPATYPPSDGYLPPEDPLNGVAFQVDAVRRCKAAAPDLVFVGSGYSYLQEWLPHVAQHEIRHDHVDFVGLGRMVLSYPELPVDVLAGRPIDKKRLCRTFSDCTTGPRLGMVSGCYPLDDAYRSLPEAARLRKLKKELHR